MEVIPKLKKVEVKPKEEPKKAEEKKVKTKVSKPKKYEELPEIPDYERPVLEVYEQSEFDPTKPEKKEATPVAQAQQATKAEPIETPAEAKKPVKAQKEIVQNEPEPKKGLVLGKGKLPEEAKNEGLPTLKPVEAKTATLTPPKLAPEVIYICIYNFI